MGPKRPTPLNLSGVGQPPAQTPDGLIDAPEDLMVDTTNGLLWSLSEGAGNRVIMGAKLTSYPPPP